MPSLFEQVWGLGFEFCRAGQKLEGVQRQQNQVLFEGVRCHIGVRPDKPSLGSVCKCSDQKTGNRVLGWVSGAWNTRSPAPGTVRLLCSRARGGGRGQGRFVLWSVVAVWRAGSWPGSVLWGSSVWFCCQFREKKFPVLLVFLNKLLNVTSDNLELQ